MSLFRTAGKKLLPESLKRRIKAASGVPGTEACLEQLKRSGFSPEAAIDVGAYSGEWTRALLHAFPGTRVLMVEPQEGKIRELEILRASYPGLKVANTLLGPAVADCVRFYEGDTASSVLPDANHGNSRFRTLPMTTLDELQERTQFPPPDFIKLDVQGYEIEVLKGAERALASAEAVQMEVNLIPIYEGAPLAHDAVAYMANRGFRLYDIGDFYRRPYDKALWQMDMMFVRASSSLVGSTRWS